MSTGIFILWVFFKVGHAGSIHSSEYTSLAACVSAKEQIISNDGWYAKYAAFCTPKSVEPTEKK